MPPHTRRPPVVGRPPFLLALIGLMCLLLIAAAPASGASASSCAEAVLVDWSDNGHVDGVYPLKCYPAAIRGLPPDVRDYSTASDEINRALAVAVNRPKPDRVRAIGKEAVGATGAATDATNSIPLALIALTGVSVLVFAAGTAGYVARRLRGEPR